MFLEPKNFTGGEAGEHRVAEFLERALEAAELGHNLVALGGGGGVAPQLGRADDGAFFVERHEAVLLAADTNRAHLAGGGPGLFQRGADARLGSVDPVGGVLLLRAGGEPANQAVSLRAFAEDFAVVCVHHQRLGGLRAAIDADD